MSHIGIFIFSGTGISGSISGNLKLNGIMMVSEEQALRRIIGGRA